MTEFNAEYTGYKKVTTKNGKNLYVLSFAGQGDITSWDAPTELKGKTYHVSFIEKEVGGTIYHNLISMVEPLSTSDEIQKNKIAKAFLEQSIPVKTSMVMTDDELSAEAHRLSEIEYKRLGKFLEHLGDDEANILTKLYEVHFKELSAKRTTYLIQEFKQENIKSFK